MPDWGLKLYVEAAVDRTAEVLDGACFSWTAAVSPRGLVGEVQDLEKRGHVLVDVIGGLEVEFFLGIEIDVLIGDRHLRVGYPGRAIGGRDIGREDAVIVEHRSAEYF